ncbi:Hypothetical protein CINCED_3A017093 [Cinara cedri]|uniref:Uncharacterized protein n=1 Tax=Cinara cedri TaxID=506608 RepID=A0A5E4MKQ4_9HEMI|nr:Hypothetical protein CINCED_3A017093 [Cinara cedri]
MSELNDNLRWAKIGHSHSNETKPNYWALKSPNNRQHYSDAFNTLKKKRKPNNNLIQNDHRIASQMKKNYFTQSSTKPKGRVQEKMQHTTDQNSRERFNIHPETSQGFNNNSLKANLNVINDVPNCSQTLTEPGVLNSTQNVSPGTSNCKAESWRETNYVYEMKNAWLSYLNYSMTGQIIPAINVPTISNPLVQNPTEVSCLESNNLNETELYCRKRMEIAVTNWMVSKFDKSSPL